MQLENIVHQSEDNYERQVFTEAQRPLSGWKGAILMWKLMIL